MSLLAATSSPDSLWVAWAQPDDEEPAADEAAQAGAPAACDACAAALDDAALAALVRRVCDQHQPSLARLYEATSGRVFGLVLRILRQPALAEEVVEDVFWQVWREAPRFDAARGRVLTWLLAIARSRAIDALRRQERVRASEQVLDDGAAIEALAAGTDGNGDDPLDLLAVTRNHTRLHALCATLEPLQRQLLALAFFRGCTHEEIAAQTGIALGTVKSHLRRTLLALRAQFADQP